MPFLLVSSIIILINYNGSSINDSYVEKSSYVLCILSLVLSAIAFMIREYEPRKHNFLTRIIRIIDEFFQIYYAYYTINLYANNELITTFLLVASLIIFIIGSLDALFISYQYFFWNKTYSLIDWIDDKLPSISIHDSGLVLFRNIGSTNLLDDN